MGAMMAPRPGATFQTNQIPAQGGKTPIVSRLNVDPVRTPPQSPYRPIGSQGGKGGGNIDYVRPLPFETGPGPQIPAQGGKAPLTQEQIDALAPNIDPVRPRPFENGPGPRIPAQGGKTQPALPPGFQSPYANYGFNPGLQSYLDRQNYMSNNDAGVAFQYDPTNQTFTGGTRGGTYNPIPLSVMQQAAGGNRDVLNPYFQSRFPQPTGPVPTIKPGMQPRPTLPVQQPTLAPSRGPAPRTIQPMVTQGLAGLVNRRR